MKRAGKYFIGLIIIVVLAAACGQRYHWVNQKLHSPQVKVYAPGESVPMEKDILLNYTMEGYAVTVNWAEILTYGEFLEKYNAGDEYTYVPDKVYDVEITLRNDVADDATGVALSEFYIQGLAVCASLDTNLLASANPQLDGAFAIALRKDSELVIHLPFGLYEANFRAGTWEQLEDFDMDFVVTLYPTKKVVPLSCGENENR